MRNPMSRPPVLADWAWISKKPGARDDYGILARSRGDIDVSEIAWQYVAGVPGANVPADAPWGPPWVTFGAFSATGGRPVISVSLQYPWDGLDQSGRPIWPRLFFACWYEDTMRRGASYQTLCAAIEQVELSRSHTSPVPLALQPQPLDGGDEDDGLVAAVREFGFEPLAAIAAALLDNRQVAVTGTMNLPLGRRVELLDAIVALLPYGFRADLSASSAVDRKITHQIRLVLTDSPADSQHAISLDAASPPRSGPGRRYFEMLLDREKHSGLPAVIGHLWNANLPYAFSDPGAAIETLVGLNRDDYVWKAVRESDPVKLTDALAVLAGPHDKVRADWQRERTRDHQTPGKLLVSLLAAEDPQAGSSLRRNWDVVVDDLVDLVNQDLNQGRVELAQRSLAAAGFAQQTTIADGLLTRLLVPQGSLPGNREVWPDPIRFRVALLRRLIPPRPDTFAGTCDALRFHEVTDWQGEFVYALLYAELAGDEAGAPAVAWASWLCTSVFTGQWPRPDWVGALGFAVTDRVEAGSAASVGRVISEMPDWAMLILRLARSFGRLRPVLEIPDFDLYLLGLALRVMAREPVTEGFRRSLADALSVPLWEREVTAETIACVDVARLVLRDSCRDFPEGRSNAQFDRYVAGLERAFGAHPDQPWREHIQTRLLEHVAGTGPQALSVAAVKLFDAWIRDAAFAPVLAGYIAANNLAEVLLSDPLLGPDFWHLLIRHNPQFKRYEPVVDLHAAVMSAIESPETELARYTAQLVDPVSNDSVFAVRPSKLAQAMYKASCSGTAADQILVAIASVSHRNATLMTEIPPLVFHQVLQEFQSLIRGRSTAEDRVPSALAIEWHAKVAEEVWAECLWLIIHGRILGPDYARTFQEAFGDRSGQGETIYKLLKRIYGPRRGLSRIGRSPDALYWRWRGHKPPALSARPQPAVPAVPASGGLQRPALTAPPPQTGPSPNAVQRSPVAGVGPTLPLPQGPAPPPERNRQIWSRFRRLRPGSGEMAKGQVGDHAAQGPPQ
jgi:hypothetical protein